MLTQRFPIALIASFLTILVPARLRAGGIIRTLDPEFRVAYEPKFDAHSRVVEVYVYMTLSNPDAQEKELEFNFGTMVLSAVRVDSVFYQDLKPCSIDSIFSSDPARSDMTRHDEALYWKLKSRETIRARVRCVCDNRIFRAPFPNQRYKLLAMQVVDPTIGRSCDYLAHAAALEERVDKSRFTSDTLYNCKGICGEKRDAWQDLLGSYILGADRADLLNVSNYKEVAKDGGGADMLFEVTSTGSQRVLQWRLHVTCLRGCDLREFVGSTSTFCIVAIVTARTTSPQLWSDFVDRDESVVTLPCSCPVANCQ